MLFSGYRYTTKGEAENALNMIDTFLGIGEKNKTKHYTSFFENNGFFYIGANPKIEEALGTATEFELIEI